MACVMYIAVSLYINTFYGIEINAARILGISWYPSPSHQATFQPIWKELSLRGHQLTVITSRPLRDEILTNLKEIDISFLSDISARADLAKIYSKNDWMWNIASKTRYFLQYLMEEVLASDGVTALINSVEEFDVVIAECHSPLVFAFGERFKAPVIAVSSLAAGLEIYDIFANPTHPLISPDFSMPMETSPKQHTFWIKCKSLIFNIWYRMFYKWQLLPKADKITKKYFGENFPYLGDICHKYSSILLTNVNLVTNPLRASLPNVVEFDQIHIRENQSLPKDIQDFLDNSSKGAVYFSLGTHILSSSLDNKTVHEIIQTFSEISLNILWKWEKNESPLSIPPNVFIKKYFPQQDLLAHPNVKVFVTQGGLQSIEEAVSREVPMVGIPFIGDQPVNVEMLVEKVLAVKVKPSEITKNSLKKAILEVAEQDKYRDSARKYKSILQDQPMKGLDKVIWWVEYVIRHNGAQHLRSPAVDMPLYEYFMIDVISFLLIVVFIFSYVSYRTTIYVKCKLKPKNKIE